MNGVSILILTKNEEKDLPGCLESVAWSDDIHVFDSLSTDRTVEIAQRYGAKVTARGFDNWATHQNWGLANLPFKHEWVLYLDADERITTGLAEEVLKTVSNANREVAFEIRRRDFFAGQWLRHVQASPFYIRLFNPACVRYERLVNPVTIVEGPVGRLDGFLDHFPFSKGISHWISRHNSYSSLEAQQILENHSRSTNFSISKALFAKDFQVRRFNQKGLFYKAPCRPLIKFLILYFLRYGFLDGRAGFVYAVLQSIYEYFIVMKVKEKTGALEE